jgi:uncharacterized protein
MNKKILALILCIILPATMYLFAQKFPKPTGYVNDFAGVMDPGSKAQIEKISTVLKEKTGVEIAVVSVETIAPYASIEEYSIDMATEWGIGKRGEDTGVLLLLAIRERMVRLEIGYGLEGIIPDGLAGEITDKSILPSLRDADYGTGLLKGVQAVTGIIAEEYDVDIDSSSISESRKYTRSVNPALIRLILIFIFILLFGGGRFLIWPLLFMGGASRRGFYGGGFGSSGSSFGGGFSGFGGGGFGGGGASRGF